jgi:hypothetical protein
MMKLMIISAEAVTKNCSVVVNSKFIDINSSLLFTTICLQMIAKNSNFHYVEELTLRKAMQQTLRQCLQSHFLLKGKGRSYVQRDLKRFVKLLNKLRKSMSRTSAILL